jgi:hypothetical protein
MNGLIPEAHEFYNQGTSQIYEDHRNAAHPSFPRSEAAKRDAADKTEKVACCLLCLGLGLGLDHDFGLNVGLGFGLDL